MTSINHYRNILLLQVSTLDPWKCQVSTDLEKSDAFEVKLNENEAVIRQEHFLQVLRHLHTQMTHMWSYQVDTQTNFHITNSNTFYEKSVMNSLELFCNLIQIDKML